MADIVGSLFGASPQAVQAEMTAPIFNRAQQFAQLNPMQQAQYGIYSGGAMLGQGIGGLLGGEDPRLVQARQMQQVKEWIAQSGVDINSPEGLAQAAQYAQSIGATEGAMFLSQQAMAKRQSIATATRTEQQAAREEQKFKLEDQLRAELSSLPPDATEEDVLNVVRKYGSPDTILKALETKATKLATEGTIGVAGSVGKSGAYRDVNGVVHGAGEMKNVNSEFAEAQKLMNDLNNITVEDVQNAYSPVGIDWTTKGDLTKKLAGAGTVSAQAKIAVAKLKQTIESLPPGSASDADMRAAMSSFPGYGDMQALAEWVNNTKRKLQFNIDKIASDYGFTPKTVSSGPLSLEGGTKEKATSKYKEGETRTIGGVTYTRDANGNWSPK